MNQLVFIQHNRVVTDSLTIAEVFNKEHKNVMRDIENQIEKLTEAGEQEWGLLNFELTQYQHPQNKQMYPKYDLTEDAFAIVAMSYVTPEAMKMKVRFLEEFKRMREQLQGTDKPKTHLEILQASISQLIDQERRLAAVEARQEHITEVLSLNTTEWRKKVNSLINKMAKKLGGFEAYSDIRNESYQRLEERSKCKLYTRTTNIQKRMALEGVSKLKIDKVNALDAIAEDARLTEIYLAIVKEMFIHYKVELIPETDMQATNLQEEDLMQTLEELPEILTAQHIAKYLHISVRRSYELMELKGFPLIRLGRSKRVTKEGFIRWLQDQEGGHQVIS